MIVYVFWSQMGAPLEEAYDATLRSHVGGLRSSYEVKDASTETRAAKFDNSAIQNVTAYVVHLWYNVPSEPDAQTMEGYCLYTSSIRIPVELLRVDQS